jgi:hypothetical protein
MSISDVFNDLHGTIDPTKFVPLRDSKSIPAEQVRKLIEYLDVDEKHLFENPAGIIYRYYYWDGLYLAPLFSVDPKQLSFMFGSVENPKQMLHYGHMLVKAGLSFRAVQQSGDYVQLFGMIDKKVLFHVYADLYREIPDEQKWEAYRAMHVRAETGFDTLPSWILRDLFSVQAFKSKKRGDRLKLLRRKVGGRDRFTVYHGSNSDFDPKDDFCWTLKREIAQFFASRFDANGVVVKKIVAFDEVLDFFDDRKEAEVLLKII